MVIELFSQPDVFHILVPNYRALDSATRAIYRCRHAVNPSMGLRCLTAMDGGHAVKAGAFNCQAADGLQRYIAPAASDSAGLTVTWTSLFHGWKKPPDSV